MARNIDIKSKLVIKDLANPKNGAILPNEGDKYTMGTVIGIANKIVTRTMPTGEIYEGLGGDFKGTPADETKNIVRSGVCYLPPGVFETVANALMGENPASSVSFGFTVYSVKSGNAAGYSYSFEPMMAPAEADPLALLEKEMVRQRAEAPQIEAPKSAAPAAAAKEAGKPADAGKPAAGKAA